jgi:uncharacterized protein YoxC
MTDFALQMSPQDPMFWVMVVVALSFVVIAIAMVSIAVFVNRAVKSVARLEQKMEPLIDRVTFLSDQGKQIAVQGREIAEQFNVVAGHISTASMYFSDSLAIIKGEVTQLKQVVDKTAIEAREKIELVSSTIDRTHQQVAQTTDFIQANVIEPAREIGAVMAGFRRGLEVLVAPAPKPINQTYGEDEMFIG